MADEPSPLDGFLDPSVITAAVAFGYSAEEVLSVAQEGSIIALACVPGDTHTEKTATYRLMSLVVTGLLFEKGMLTRRKE